MRTSEGPRKRPFEKRQETTVVQWRQLEGKYLLSTVPGLPALLQVQVIEPPLLLGDRMKVLLWMAAFA